MLSIYSIGNGQQQCLDKLNLKLTNRFYLTLFSFNNYLISFQKWKNWLNSDPKSYARCYLLFNIQIFLFLVTNTDAKTKWNVKNESAKSGSVNIWSRQLHEHRRRLDCIPIGPPSTSTSRSRRICCSQRRHFPHSGLSSTAESKTRLHKRPFHHWNTCTSQRCSCGCW